MKYKMTKYETRCDNCDSKKVIRNIQLCWVEYDYDYETGEYSDEPDNINEPVENLHYCEKCYAKWENGDLF